MKNSINLTSCLFYKRAQITVFSIQLFPFLIMGLNIHAPFSVGRNVVVNRFRNKILIGYNYRTIKSLGYEGCLESCLGDCRCLTFQVCGFSNDCQLSNSSKTLINGSAVEDSTSCDHFEFNYQGMMKVEVTSNIRIRTTVYMSRPTADTTMKQAFWLLKFRGLPLIMHVLQIKKNIHSFVLAHVQIV